MADFKPLASAHWETGSIRNAFAAQGIVAPHTGQPISEALLFGISGGAAVGHFIFEYKGFDPHFVILVRNTFDPVETLLNRLGIESHVKETTVTAKAAQHLTDALNAGKTAIVWADYATLPYNESVIDDSQQYAIMFPIAVYNCEDNIAFIADRAGVPLKILADELSKVRGNHAGTKNRLITVNAPDFDKLPAAVEAGIRQCVSLYLEAPPKGAKDNFGLAALQKWASSLTDEKDKRGWAKVFPRGSALYHALVPAFRYIEMWGTDGAASRGQYADFLDEAAVILNKSALKDAAVLFRETVPLWHDLANGLLPDSVEPLRKTREGLLKRHALFIERGMDGLDEARAVQADVNVLKANIIADFPMSDAEVAALRADVRERVLRVHDAEQAAVLALKDAID